ncbi:hypothetical protein M9458_051836, partial [Cirrhinus mrigala]
MSYIYSSSTRDTLYWYRQYGKSKPEFLVLTYSSAQDAKKSDVDPRLTVKVEKMDQIHADLKISSAAVSDSALYCTVLCSGAHGDKKHISSLQKPVTMRDKKRSTEKER